MPQSVPVAVVRHFLIGAEVAQFARAARVVEDERVRSVHNGMADVLDESCEEGVRK